MNITEIRTKLVSDSSERLRAYCSITIDGDFVIRDLKIIDGPNGPFLAMPSRKLADRCQKCGAKNHLRARFCNECGTRLPENRAPRDGMGRSKLHADVAHPINAACRERIQKAVVDAFLEEVEASQQPGYQPADYDEYEEESDLEPTVTEAVDEEIEEDVEEEIVATDDAAPEDDDFGFGAGLDDEGEAVKPRGRTARRDAGTTDYDSLIADLKRDAAGRRTGDSRDRDRRDDRRTDRVEPPRQPARSDRGARPRGDRDRGRDGGPRGRRDDRRSERRDAPPPREHGHRAGRTPVAEAPKPEPKPVTPPPPQPKPKPVEDDPMSDFGAGIF